VRTTIATVHSEALPGSGPARVELVVVEGPDAGRSARLEPNAEVVVGTDPDAGLVLTDDRVSRRHVTVRREGGRFAVKDLGSTNGTLFEGSRVTEAVVGPGATLKVGRTALRIQPEAEAIDVAPSQSRRFGELVAESLAMREVFAVLELAAATDVTVLIEGETGTGKELAARALHDASARRPRPFVGVDCGALPETLVDSELFGHVRGAFTGAATPRAGAFARAEGGTIFLDELGAVPAAVQARLLRVIEERKVRPLGADEERAVDVRIIAGSGADLSVRVAEGAFRPDLWFRLSVVRVVLPPLRARREDIKPIVAELLRRRGLDPGPIEGANHDRLVAHDWPGNVRELRNVIDRAVALSPGAKCFADLRVALTATASEEPLAVRGDLPYSDARQLVLSAFERRYLRDLWERAEGNLSAAARMAGMDRKHLRTLLRKNGLLPDAGDDS
jgi:DNA-binding NtrC family response regulator